MPVCFPAWTDGGPSSMSMRRLRAAAITCTVQSVNGTAFQTTDAGSVATGACIPGYQQGASAPTLTCDLAGNWAVAIDNPCNRTPERTFPRLSAAAGAVVLTRGRPVGGRDCGPLAEITCAAIPDDGTAAWPSGVAGDPPALVSGSCDAGYYVAAGAPYRGCDITGTWQVVQNPCQRKAPVVGCRTLRSVLTRLLAQAVRACVPVSQRSLARRSRSQTTATPPGRPVLWAAACRAPVCPATPARRRAPATA